MLSHILAYVMGRIALNLSMGVARLSHDNFGIYFFGILALKFCSQKNLVFIFAILLLYCKYQGRTEFKSALAN